MITGSNTRACHYSQLDTLPSPQTDKADDSFGGTNPLTCLSSFCSLSRPNSAMYLAFLMHYFNTSLPFLLDLLTWKQKLFRTAELKPCTSTYLLPLVLQSISNWHQLLTPALVRFGLAHYGIKQFKLSPRARFQCSTWNSHPTDKRPQVSKISDRI